jgi:hypothetical protein
MQKFGICFGWLLSLLPWIFQILGPRYGQAMHDSPLPTAFSIPESTAYVISACSCLACLLQRAFRSSCCGQINYIYIPSACNIGKMPVLVCLLYHVHVYSILFLKLFVPIVSQSLVVYLYAIVRLLRA